MTIIWCMTPEIPSMTGRIFCHFGPFLPFYPPNNPKNQNSKKWKKNTSRNYHFTHIYHKWQSFDVWFLRYGAWWTKFFIILDHFLDFYPPNYPRNQNFEKWKHHLEILSLYTYVPQMKIIWCMVPEIWRMWQTEFFVILDHFLPLYLPLQSEKSKFWKN